MKMESSFYLKPCPFCGDKGWPNLEEHEDWAGNVVMCNVKCLECECYTRSYPKKEDAIERWNQRA